MSILVLEERIAEVLIGIRSNMSYEVFQGVDKHLRHLLTCLREDRAWLSGDLFAKRVAHELKYVERIYKVYPKAYGHFKPKPGDVNYIPLVPGKKYVLSLQSSFLKNLSVSYVGRDLSYLCGETHVFSIIDPSIFDNIEDIDLFTLFTNVCTSFVNHDEKTWMIHVCPDKFTLQHNERLK